MQTVLDVHWFNWNDIEWTGLWNFNHTNFKILTQKWHWNYAKTVSQLIEIKFSKSLPDYCIFSAEMYTFCILFIIFCVLWIFEYFFFWIFSNTLKITNPEFQNFPVSKSIVIRKNSKHVFRNREIVRGKKNRIMN